MRYRPLSLSLALVLAIACGDDPSLPFASVQWEIDCNLDGGCPRSSGLLTVTNLDGEQGFDVSCSIASGSGGSKVISFDVSSDDGWELAATNIITVGSSGTVQAGATVSAEFEGNTYEGSGGSTGPVLNDCAGGEACSDSSSCGGVLTCVEGTCQDPECSVCDTVLQPCKLSGIAVSGSRVTGEMLCLCLPAQADNARTREIFGGGGFDDDIPLASPTVSFRFENCS